TRNANRRGARRGRGRVARPLYRRQRCRISPCPSALPCDPPDWRGGSASRCDSPAKHPSRDGAPRAKSFSPLVLLLFSPSFLVLYGILLSWRISKWTCHRRWPSQLGPLRRGMFTYLCASLQTPPTPVRGRR